MLEAAMKAKDKRVKVGFPAGKDSVQDGVSALDKAIWNNYGLGVPKRPFMAIAFAQNVEKYKKFLFKKISENPEDIDIHLDKVGAMGYGDVIRTITDLRTPPNSQVTIDRKNGSSNPLIATEHMRKSVTWEVV
jgi:hypothetical protein